MGDLYQYTDYREYLRDWYAVAKEKSPVMTYRYMATKLNIDPGFLVHIMQGHKHLSEKHLPALARALALGKGEFKYFERLFLFGKARSETEIARRFKDLMELRSMQSRTLGSKQYQYYEKWYVPTIRCLVAARGFRGDYADLAKQLDPAITADEAMFAIKLLEKLGMLKRNKEGEFEVLDTFVTTGDSWVSFAIRDYQRQTMELAQRALMEQPKEKREISTMTFAIPSNEMPAIQEMAREFRQKVMHWALHQSDADTVVQFNLQVFTVVKP